MNWNEARSRVESLGVDWRMPTLDELEGLYNKGKEDRNMTPLLKTSGWWNWSGDAKGSSSARIFGLEDGDSYWVNRGNNYPSYNYRVFAVRSRGDG